MDSPDGGSSTSIEYVPELIYPREIVVQKIESKVTSYEFLGKTLTRKELALQLDLEVWGFSEHLVWSYVFDSSQRTIHVLFVGKSEFIRDPVLHRFAEKVIIDEPSGASPDWHEDWEVFVSREKPAKCPFHDPSSFACYDWISLGRF